MSIDATIVGLVKLPDGSARFTLEQPDRSRCAGQSVLNVAAPLPKDINVLLGKPVWGGDATLMCGHIRIGRRVGYTGIVLDNDALIRVRKHSQRERLPGELDAIDLVLMQGEYDATDNPGT